MINHFDKQSRRNFKIYHLPLIGYTFLILVVSSIPYLQAPDLPEIGIDKLAHFVEYFIFGWLAIRSFQSLFSRRSPQRALISSLLFSITFAAVEELHQNFIPGRTVDLYDFVADCLGIILIHVYAIFVYRRRSGLKT